MQKDRKRGEHIPKEISQAFDDLRGPTYDGHFYHIEAKKMSDCLFCKIAARQIPATIVFEDDKVVAFRDIHPQAPVHLLIIPKLHVGTVNELERPHAPLIGHMVLAAQQLAKQEGIAETGYRLAMNCNDDGGQTVYHIHLHLLGGRAMHWPPG